MVRIAFALLLVGHGLNHLMGFAKAFRLAELPQLTQPVSRAAGVAWLAAALLLVASAAAVLARPRGFWALGLAALAVSQALIFTSWRDARYGTIASAVVLVGVAYGFLAFGPRSFRAAMDRDVAAGLARQSAQPVVTERDVAPLPPPVQRYLRFTGSVGQERVQGVRVRFAGELRGGPAGPWMRISAVQYSFFDRPTRLFLLVASRSGVPFEAFHRYLGPAATFQVKLLSLVRIVDARGPEVDRSETVTFLNDMAVLAPATLLSPEIRWEPVDDRTARATLKVGPETVRAELQFDGAGRLVGFWSDDRMMSSADGKSFRPARWSTPLSDYRAFGARRLAARGRAVWRLAEGEFDYARFEVVDVEYNPAR